MPTGAGQALLPPCSQQPQCNFAHLPRPSSTHLDQLGPALGVAVCQQVVAQRAVGQQLRVLHGVLEPGGPGVAARAGHAAARHRGTRGERRSGERRPAAARDGGLSALRQFSPIAGPQGAVGEGVEVGRESSNCRSGAGAPARGPGRSDTMQVSPEAAQVPIESRRAVQQVHAVSAAGWRRGPLLRPLAARGRLSQPSRPTPAPGPPSRAACSSPPPRPLRSAPLDPTQTQPCPARR